MVEKSNSNPKKKKEKKPEKKISMRKVRLLVYWNLIQGLIDFIDLSAYCNGDLSKVWVG